MLVMHWREAMGAHAGLGVTQRRASRPWRADSVQKSVPPTGICYDGRQWLAFGQPREPEPREQALIRI
jgi:hypothetical protein